MYTADTYQFVMEKVMEFGGSVVLHAKAMTVESFNLLVCSHNKFGTFQLS